MNLHKKRLVFGTITLLLVAFFLVNSFNVSTPIEEVALPRLHTESSLAFANEAIQPIPLNVLLDPNKVLLGERLFHDARLSGDGSVACSNCHGLTSAGTVSTPRSKGINGQLSKRNPPTVFNSAYNFTQHWDGQFATLEQQINGPLHNALEMASDWPSILSKLRQDANYVALFSQLYIDSITEGSVKDAIATFEKSLITPNSPFDQYLRGDTDILTSNEKEGYQLFSSLGCISCHQGVNVGGNLFHKIGLFQEYKSSNPRDEIDLGRFEITRNENDKYVFKVPSLRNVEKTAPYFHDGSVATLEDAIKLMAVYQLGRDISQEEVDKISAFLKTLTGTYKGNAL